MRQTNTYIRVSDFFTTFFFFLNICLVINREGGGGQWQRQRQRQERHHARSLKLSNLILYIYSYLSYHFLNSLSYPLCFTNQIHITKHVIFPLNMFFRKHQIFGAMNFLVQWITAEMHQHYLFDDIPLNMFFREHQIFGAMNRWWHRNDGTGKVSTALAWHRACFVDLQT